MLGRQLLIHVVFENPRTYRFSVKMSLDVFVAEHAIWIHKLYNIEEIIKMGIKFS